MYFLQLLSNPIAAIIFLIILVCTISIHEFAHALAADQLGDPTPAAAGRLTLNPKAHLDPMGALMFMFIGFGWGRPVPFDPYNLKNPRRDAALISLAGPASNIAIALLSSLLLYLFNYFSILSAASIGYLLLMLVIRLNIILALFNLIPIAPLDGFKIIGGILSEEQARDWYSLERFGIFFLLFLIFPIIGNRSMLDLFILPIITAVINLLLP